MRKAGWVAEMYRKLAMGPVQHSPEHMICTDSTENRALSPLPFHTDTEDLCVWRYPGPMKPFTWDSKVKLESGVFKNYFCEQHP